VAGSWINRHPWQATPRGQVGLHPDLGQRVYFAERSLTLYAWFFSEDKTAVKREISRQLDMFLVGRDPSYINSHQNFHMRESVRSIALQLYEELGIPIRNLCSEFHYFGKFYGQTKKGPASPGAYYLDCRR
jgi:predicted glycoside hydrolase/deacetylase ChbG (UPF0249 family)